METQSPTYTLGVDTLGVDAGNTKTIALVARLDGTIVEAGRGGCGDIYDSTKGRGNLSFDHARRR